VATELKLLAKRLNEIVENNKENEFRYLKRWRADFESKEFVHLMNDRSLIGLAKRTADRKNCSFLCAMISIFMCLREMDDALREIR
jgi:hypothetical protein